MGSGLSSGVAWITGDLLIRSRAVASNTAGNRSVATIDTTGTLNQTGLQVLQPLCGKIVILGAHGLMEVGWCVVGKQHHCHVFRIFTGGVDDRSYALELSVSVLRARTGARDESNNSRCSLNVTECDGRMSRRGLQ